MKRFNFFILILFVFIILFRSNILIFFNNFFNLFLVKNDVSLTEIMVLEQKIEYLEKEYENLNEFKEGISDYATYEYLVSRVIYKENYFYNSLVTIEKGSDDGVSEGMAVLNEKGLVGVIKSVDKNVSDVTLLTNTSVSVKINDSYGKLVYEDKKFKIKDISREENIKLNDEVYTSELGNIKEKVYVGKVINVENGILEKEIIVESDVNFNDLNYLLIVGDL